MKFFSMNNFAKMFKHIRSRVTSEAEISARDSVVRDDGDDLVGCTS